jgi:hypothetical protein
VPTDVCSAALGHRRSFKSTAKKTWTPNRLYRVLIGNERFWKNRRFWGQRQLHNVRFLNVFSTQMRRERHRRNIFSQKHVTP